MCTVMFNQAFSEELIRARGRGVGAYSPVIKGQNHAVTSKGFWRFLIH